MTRKPPAPKPVQNPSTAHVARRRAKLQKFPQRDTATVSGSSTKNPTAQKTVQSTRSAPYVKIPLTKQSPNSATIGQKTSPLTRKQPAQKRVQNPSTAHAALKRAKLQRFLQRDIQK